MWNQKIDELFLKWARRNILNLYLKYSCGLSLNLFQAKVPMAIINQPLNENVVELVYNLQSN